MLFMMVGVSYLLVSYVTSGIKSRPSRIQLEIAAICSAPFTPPM